MPTPSISLSAQCTALSRGAHAIRNHTRAAISQAYAEGIRFPDLLDHLLHDLEQAADQLQLLLAKPSFADNPPRREESDNSPNPGSRPLSPSNQTPA